MAHPYRSEAALADSPRPSAIEVVANAVRGPWCLPLLLGILPLSLFFPWMSSPSVMTGWERLRSTSNTELVLLTVAAALTAVVSDRVGVRAERWPARLVAAAFSGLAAHCYFLFVTFPLTFRLLEQTVFGGGLWLAGVTYAVVMLRAAALVIHALATPFRMRRLRVASFVRH